MQSNCAKSQSSPAEEEVPAMLLEISNNNATEVTTPEQFYWGEVKGSDFTKLIDSCYEKSFPGETALATQGGSGPSGFDADGCRRPLT